MRNDRWEELEPGIHLLRDSCNVYAVQGPEGTVLINAGTGLAAECLNEVASGPVYILLTHHFRDHTAGAERLAAQGAKLYGPYWEQTYLTDPEQHFRERQIWNSYDNRWDRFSPIRPLPMSGWMMDYDRPVIAGIQWEVHPAPGVTTGASIYIAHLNGRKLAFVGELIHGPGKIGRMAPLQYNYNDLTGAVNLYYSAKRLKDEKADRLFPSLGDTCDEPESALNELMHNLKRIDEIMPGFVDSLREIDKDDIQDVLPHLLRSRKGGACTHFVIGKTGKVLALDYGYNELEYRPPAKYHLSNRRPMLHGTRGLEKRLGSSWVDAVLVTHYHDDHINGIPMLQRLYGTECWAGENFADILERPDRYDRPCLWHEPVTVHRKLPTGVPLEWDGVSFTLQPMSGHTQFATLILMEIDGKRVAHTGDQIFFTTPDGSSNHPGARQMTNHVYKNGLNLGDYRVSYKHLLEFQPDIVLTGHLPPYEPDERFYTALEQGARAFDEVHSLLMPLTDEEIHFGAESQPAKLKPYRMIARDGEKVTFEGWVLNPFKTKQTARLCLIGPDGWTGDPVEYELQPREKKDIEVSINIPKGVSCQRQPIALEMTVGGRPFGQVTEALVTVSDSVEQIR